MSYKYKESRTLDSRKMEAERILKKYPDRIPVICEKHAQSDVPDIDKTKYLVPMDLNVGQFIYVVRKRLKLAPEKALFLFVDGMLPPTGMATSPPPPPATVTVTGTHNNNPNLTHSRAHGGALQGVEGR